MKPKSIEQQIRECVRKISDDNLKTLSIRLSQRLGGDLGEALVLIQDEYPDLNKILSSAVNCTEVYNLVDMIDKQIQEIASKRIVK